MSVKKTTVVTNTAKNVVNDVLTVRLPSELLELLDKFVERKLFSSRSEAIREFCREYVQENRQLLHQERDGKRGAGRG